MALALKSRHDGIIRFYRERPLSSGDLLAVFAPNGDHGPGFRGAYDPIGGYCAVPVEYLRNRCRPAQESDMVTAMAILEQIDARADYVNGLQDSPAGA